MRTWDLVFSTRFRYSISPLLSSCPLVLGYELRGAKVITASGFYNNSFRFWPQIQTSYELRALVKTISIATVWKRDVLLPSSSPSWPNACMKKCLFSADLGPEGLGNGECSLREMKTQIPWPEFTVLFKTQPMALTVLRNS